MYITVVLVTKGRAVFVYLQKLDRISAYTLGVVTVPLRRQGWIRQMSTDNRRRSYHTYILKQYNINVLYEIGRHKFRGPQHRI